VCAFSSFSFGVFCFFETLFHQMTQVTPGGPVPQPPMGLPGLPGAPVITMPRPEDIPQIEHLQQIQKLYVKQKIDWLELFVNYDVSNQYEVFLTAAHKDAGQRWLFAKEQSSSCQRMCIPRLREFDLDIGITRPGINAGAGGIEQSLGLVESSYVFPMVRVHRPCFCCLSQISVQDGRGQNIGHAKEACTNMLECCPAKIHMWAPGKTPENGDEPEYLVDGPLICWMDFIGKCPCRKPFSFDVTHLKTERKVGAVSNVPNGCCKMCFTNADDYEIDYAPDATPQERGVLLALTFMLDFKFFEAKQEKKHNNNVGLAF